MVMELALALGAPVSETRGIVVAGRIPLARTTLKAVVCQCSICRVIKQRQDFSESQWCGKKATEKKCKACIQSIQRVYESRLCSACSSNKPFLSFSKTQWKKGDTERKCILCLANAHHVNKIHSHHPIDYRPIEEPRYYHGAAIRFIV